MLRWLHILLLSACCSFANAQLNTERLMNIGRNALYYDDYVLSIQYFNLVINSKPYLHEPYFFRGLAKFHLDDFVGAENDCSIAIEKNPYYPSSYEVRGLARINLGNWYLAAQDYKTVTGMEPENKSLWHNYVLCELEMDSLDKADSLVNIIIKKWPKYAEGYSIKAQIKMQQKDTIAAEEIIDQAIIADPYNVNVLNAKAGLLMQHEQYAEAELRYNESIRLNPKSAQSLINRALCRYHQDNYRGAMRDYDLALDIEPGNFYGHYNRGLLRANVGEDNAAIEDFNFILNIDPNDMMATFNRATLLEQTGDYRGAIRDYTTVIKAYPKFLLGYQRRMEVRRKIGDKKGANSDEEHILKEQIAHRYGYSTPTSRQKNRTRKKSSQEIDDYQKLVVADEDTTQHYESALRGKIQNKEVDASLIETPTRTYYINKDTKGENALALFNSAYKKAQKGEVQDAIKDLDTVIELDKNFAEAYYNRGLLKLLIEDMTATSDLSKAGELGIYQAYNIIKKHQKKKK